jgi:hypothetical protein
MVNAPILALPESGKRFTVYMDASRIGIGCVLMHEGRVIAYGSRQLKKHEGTILLMTSSWSRLSLP